MINVSRRYSRWNFCDFVVFVVIIIIVGTYIRGIYLCCASFMLEHILVISGIYLCCVSFMLRNGTHLSLPVCVSLFIFSSIIQLFMLLRHIYVILFNAEKRKESF
jgi:hypothetical protein